MRRSAAPHRGAADAPPPALGAFPRLGRHLHEPQPVERQAQQVAGWSARPTRPRNAPQPVERQAQQVAGRFRERIGTSRKACPWVRRNEANREHPVSRAPVWMVVVLLALAAAGTVVCGALVEHTATRKARFFDDGHFLGLGRIALGIAEIPRNLHLSFPKPTPARR